MNEKFISYFKKKEKTTYWVSKETGIPYTTLSELLNQKIDINKCAAGMVFRLSLYFNCSVENLLNSESLITNVSGVYQNIKYKWIPAQTKGCVQLKIQDYNQEHIIDEGLYAQSRFYSTYKCLTEALIDAYLQQKEVEEMMDD